MAELFPREVRYSATAFSCNLPVAIFGGMAPLVATFLVTATGNDDSPAFYRRHCRSWAPWRSSSRRKPAIESCTDPS